MKKPLLYLLTLFACSIALIAFAQSPAPSVTSLPSIVAPSAAQPVTGTKFYALVTGIALALNAFLSVLQQVFSALGKLEPVWLKNVSSVMLTLSKFFGSNPNV